MKPGRKFRVKKSGCIDEFTDIDYTSKKREREDVEERHAKRVKVIDLTKE